MQTREDPIEERQFSYRGHSVEVSTGMSAFTYKGHLVEIYEDSEEIGDGLVTIIVATLAINHLCDNRKQARQTAQQLIDDAPSGGRKA
jgi:hypothetical protein